MDVLTPEQRHKAMSHIKSKDTSIEVSLRHALWHKGYRYRKNYKKLPGSPDIAITRYKIAIFCDGELFHGKDWGRKLHYKLAHGKNPDFWVNKVERNMRRDIRVNNELMMDGWIVLRFWGLDIQHHVDKCVAAVDDAVQSRQSVYNEDEAYTDYLNMKNDELDVKYDKE